MAPRRPEQWLQKQALQQVARMLMQGPHDGPAHAPWCRVSMNPAPLSSSSPSNENAPAPSTPGCGGRGCRRRWSAGRQRGPRLWRKGGGSGVCFWAQRLQGDAGAVLHPPLALVHWCGPGSIEQAALRGQLAHVVLQPPPNKNKHPPWCWNSYSSKRVKSARMSGW